MPTAKKAEEIAELEDMVRRSMVAFSASYRGMTVAEMTALRRRMRDSQVDVRVVKNTLLRIASERAGKPDLVKIASGPTAVMFAYDDIAGPAKVLQEYIRTARSALTLTAAYLDGDVMGPAEAATLADLPSRTDLIAGFMGGIQSPIQQFAGLITGVVREFAGLIEARASQLEEQPA
jgi:large subunit ribosomal protein L10